MALKADKCAQTKIDKKKTYGTCLVICLIQGHVKFTFRVPQRRTVLEVFPKKRELDNEKRTKEAVYLKSTLESKT